MLPAHTRDAHLNVQRARKLVRAAYKHAAQHQGKREVMQLAPVLGAGGLGL